MRKTLKHVLTEYGAIALTLYLTIFFAVFFGFWLAIELGFREQLDGVVNRIAGWFGASPSSNVAGGAAAWLLAYGATKLVQPLRIALTIVLTPFIAKAYDRVRGRQAATGPEGPVEAP